MVLRSPDSFSCEPVDMEKLMEIRNAHLVRVRGKLAAAENLAGRQVSVGEAQDRLNLFRELAGDFRRTQTAIEEEEEDPEASAKIHDYREEFNEPYYSAINILERYVSAHSPAKSGFPPSGNKNNNNNHELRETMRLFIETQRAMAEQYLVPNLEEMLMQAERILEKANAKEEKSRKPAFEYSDPETQLGNGNMVEVATETLLGIDDNLPQTRIHDDSDFEASLLTFRDQEEVPKLQQLTSSDQTAAEVTRNGNGRFIVRLPVDDSKPTPSVTDDLGLDFRQESALTSGKVTHEEVTFTAELRLRWQVSVDALDKHSGLVRIRKALLFLAMARRRVGEIPVHIGLCLSRQINSVKERDAECIPQRRQNRWNLMHCPTSEMWKRGQSMHLVGLQPGTEKRLLKANVNEDERFGPPVQIGSGDEGGTGFDCSHPDDDAAKGKGGDNAIGSKSLRDDNELRHKCLKAGEYVPVI